MHVYVKNNCAKFHPDSIWNDTALGFFKQEQKREEEQQKQGK